MLKTRKNMAKVVVMSCIAAFMAFASIAQAGDAGWGGGYGGNHHHHSFRRLAKKLALTDAQKAQVKVIFQGNKDVVKPIFASLHAEQKKLRTLMHTDPIDDAAVAAIRAETATIAGIQADLNVNRAKVGAQFRAILTSAQLATLKTLHQRGHTQGDTATVPAPAE